MSLANAQFDTRVSIGRRQRPTIIPSSIFSFPFSVSPKGGNMATSKTTIGYAVQLGGIAAFTIGGILSLHHVAIGASFLGGAAAFYVGQKIRALT
jgi:hypothetical protein